MSAAIDYPFSIQDMDDGPGPLTQVHDGLFLRWNNERRAFVMAAAEGGDRVIVGSRSNYGYIQRLQDGPGALGAGDNGKALVWNDATKKFVMAVVSGGDATTLEGHPASYFEIAGTAADTMTAHLAASDPHAQYLLDSDVSAFGLTLIDDVDAAAARSTLGLGTMATQAAASYLLASGATTGATGGMQTLTTGVITPIWRPISNGTAAMKIQNASGGLDVLTVDTTNNVLDITGTLKNVTGGLSSFTSGTLARQCLFSANSYFTGNGTWNTILSTLPGWRFDLAAHGIAAADEFALYYRVAGAAANAWTKYFTLNGRTGIISTTGDDTNTATITNHITMRRSSSGTPAAGFGIGILAQLESSTTADQNVGHLTWEWDDATHATRASRGKLTAYYTGTERTCVDWKANSTVGLIGFLGAAPVARPAAYTQTYSTAARTIAAYTTDAESVAYTGIDNLQVGTVYAQLADLNFLRAAYENLRASYDGLIRVVNSIIDDNQAYGLFA